MILLQLVDFLQWARSVVLCLQVSSALDVVFFVREICETHPALRPSILERLRDTFSTVRASRVVRADRNRIYRLCVEF